MSDDYEEIDDSYTADKWEDINAEVDNTIERLTKKKDLEGYGQRYPKGASSIESDKGVKAGTTVQIRKEKDLNLHKLYGQKLPSVNEPATVTLLNTLTELLRSTKRLERIEMAKIPLGQTFTFNIQLVSTGKLLHIDFEDPTGNTGVPNNTIINAPQRKLFQLHVFNDGSGEVGVSINLKASEDEARMNLKNGESKSFEFPVALIQTVNLVATTGTANIRMIAVI